MPAQPPGLAGGPQGFFAPRATAVQPRVEASMLRVCGRHGGPSVKAITTDRPGTDFKGRTDT